MAVGWPSTCGPSTSPASRYVVLAASSRETIALVRKVVRTRKDYITFDVSRDYFDLIKKVMAKKPDLLIIEDRFYKNIGENLEEGSPNFSMVHVLSDRSGKTNQMVNLDTDEEQIIDMVDGLASSSSKFCENIVIRVGNRERVVPISSVNYFYSEDHATYVHIGNRSYYYHEPLRNLERILDPADFFRVHRKLIIGRHYVDSWVLGSPMTIFLKNGKKVNVPRVRKQNVRTFLANTVTAPVIH